jgi:hypothetical protein
MTFMRGDFLLLASDMTRSFIDNVLEMFQLDA